MVANPEQVQEAVFILDAMGPWFHITECVSGNLFCRAKCEQGGADRISESRGGNYKCIILHPKPEGSLISEEEEARIQSMLEKLKGRPNCLNPDGTYKE